MNTQTQDNSDAVMRAALKMAIEALEWAVSNAKIIRDFPKDDVAKYANKTIGVCEDKIQACKEALASNSEAIAQPAQEPSKLTFEQLNTPFGIYSTPLYTHPAPEQNEFSGEKNHE